MKEIRIEMKKAKLTEEIHKVQGSNASRIEGQTRNDERMKEEIACQVSNIIGKHN